MYHLNHKGREREQEGVRERGAQPSRKASVTLWHADVTEVADVKVRRVEEGDEEVSHASSSQSKHRQ